MIDKLFTVDVLAKSFLAGKVKIEPQEAIRKSNMDLAKEIHDDSGKLNDLLKKYIELSPKFGSHVDDNIVNEIFELLTKGRLYGWVKGEFIK